MITMWNTLRALADIGQFLSAVAALILVLLTRTQLRSLQDQVKHSHDQTEAAVAAVLAAQESATAAQDAVREAARTRADETSPRVMALLEAPHWPPLVDSSRSGMPYANALRLLDPRSIHASQQANEAQPFVFDRDRQTFMWFQMRGLLINEGHGTARVRLDGEAQFVEGTSPYAQDEDIPVPPQVGTERNREYLLRPGDKAIFEWGYGHTLGEWADAYDNANPPNPLGACFLTVTVLDSYANGVIDHIYVEMAARPIEPVPGTIGQWHLTDDRFDNTGVVIYPTQRTYRAEGHDYPPAPWLETYAAWTDQHEGA